MAWTQADLDALKAARAAGVKTVAYGDKSVTYNSPADMVAVQLEMEEELGLRVSGGRVTYASFSRE
jgi:hypothetical protein